LSTPTLEPLQAFLTLHFTLIYLALSLLLLWNSYLQFKSSIAPHCLI
jgi:hypothetical protein